MIQYKDSLKKEKFFKLIQKENIFCEANDSLWQALDDLKSLIPFKLIVHYECDLCLIKKKIILIKQQLQSHMFDHVAPSKKNAKQLEPV